MRGQLSLKTMKSSFFLACWLFLGMSWLMAQTDSTAVAPKAKAKTTTDSTANKPTDPPMRFSLVFNRGFMLTGSAPDTVPLSSTRSGTYFIGGGIRFPLTKTNTLGLRLTPGVAWTHISYAQTNLKTFPYRADTLGSNLSQERHRQFFIDLPLGVYFNLTKDEDNDPKFYLEAGGYVSYLLAAQYRYKYDNAQGRTVTVREQNLAGSANEFERLRYGLYGRVGYKWAALYVSYRLSEVFDEFADDPAPAGFRNPAIPPLELGISIFL
jgi:hypothetical protein